MAPSRMPVWPLPCLLEDRLSGRRADAAPHGLSQSLLPDRSQRCLRGASGRPADRWDILNHFKAATSSLGWGSATEIQKLL